MSVALSASIATFPTSSITSVSLAIRADINTITKVASQWQAYVVKLQARIDDKAKAIPKDKSIKDASYLAQEYLKILELFQESLASISKCRSATDPCKILQAKDSSNAIQALACYWIGKFSTPPKLFVSEIVAAPWNIRWPIALEGPSPPVRGSGTLLLHALFQIFDKDSDLNRLCLYASYYSVGFYEKIGMEKDDTSFPPYFFFSHEHRERMNAALVRAFGDSFRYSLLLCEATAETAKK